MGAALVFTRPFAPRAAFSRGSARAQAAFSAFLQYEAWVAMDTSQNGWVNPRSPAKRLFDGPRRSRLTLSVTGVGPAADDAVKAELALERLPGVIHAYVNPVTEMAYIVYDPQLTGESDLAEGIASAGFRAPLGDKEGGMDGD